MVEDTLNGERFDFKGLWYGDGYFFSLHFELGKRETAQFLSPMQKRQESTLVKNKNKKKIK